MNRADELTNTLDYAPAPSTREPSRRRRSAGRAVVITTLATGSLSALSAFLGIDAIAARQDYAYLNAATGLAVMTFVLACTTVSLLLSGDDPL